MHPTFDAAHTVGVRGTGVNNRMRSRHLLASISRVIGRVVLKWLVSLALLILIWEVLAHSNAVPRILFPTVFDTLNAGAGLWEAGVLISDITASLRRVFVGFALGASVGVMVGLMTGRVWQFDFVLSPMIILFRPIPAIALVPLATVWFGIGETAKYFVIAYAVFLAVWLNVHAGALSVSDTHLRVAASLGASRSRTFLEVILPAAAPDIIQGLRYGSAVAFIVLIAAELAGAGSGLGFRIQASSQFQQTDRIFFVLVELAILGSLLDGLFVVVSRKLVHWGER